MDDGEGVQPEEVHLEHAHILDVVAVELGSPHVQPGLLVLGKANGDVVRKVAAADDGGAGVLAHLAYAALQRKRIFQDFLVDLGAVLELVLEIGDQAVAVLEVDLDIHLLHALLEGLLHLDLLPGIVRVVRLDLLLEGLETGLQLVQLGIERVFLLHLLAETVRDHLGEPGGLVYAEAADARDVLDGALGGHRAEGDDPGHVVGAIDLLHVFVGRAEVLEIHVYIRHADTVRIQETLEQQGVLDRVQIGDSQAVSHDGTGRRATPRTHHESHFARSRDVVLDNEEIVRETHLADGLQLEVDALGLLVGQGVAVALPRTLIGEVAEEGDGLAELIAAVGFGDLAGLLVLGDVVFSFLNDILVLLQMGVDVGQEVQVDVEFWQDVRAVYLESLHLAADLHRIGDGLRMAGEDIQHLLLALYILLLGIAQAALVVHHRIGSQADKPVVDGAVLLPYEVRVVGGDHLDPHLLRQLENLLVDDLLAVIDLCGEARDLGLVEHHLEVIVVPEHAFVPFYGLARAVDVPGEYVLGDLPREAGGAADQVLVVFLDYPVVHARTVVHALDVPRGHDLHQILIAVVILREKDKVVVALVLRILQAVVVVPRDIHLAADDGLHYEVAVRILVALVVGILEELLHAVHVAVVGDGQGGHAEFPGALEELPDVGESVKDGILGMDVEVYE